MNTPNSGTMTPAMDPSAISTPEQFAKAVTEKPAEWMHHYNQLRQENDQLRQGLEARQNELATALVRAQAYKDLLDESHRSQTPQPARSTKLPDPDKFSEVRTELKYFITQLQLKI